MTEDEFMLTSILNCSRMDILLGDKTLSYNQQRVYRTMKKRRIQGEPLQYIIGNCDFMGCTINIDKRVFIPRPETEIMTEIAVNKIKDFFGNKNVNILDLGTGSGNIAISIAKNINNCKVTSVDISKNALSLAKENASSNLVFNKICFVNEDMNTFLKSNQHKKYDIVISNPPYIATAELENLPDDVKNEPKIALDGGADGLKYYKDIISLSKNILTKLGFIIFEIGDGQVDAIKDMFCNYNSYGNIEIVKDYVGTDRIMIAKLSS